MVADTVDAAVTSVTVTSSQGACTTLPCSLGTLALGASATVQISGTLSPAYAGTILANRADVTSVTTSSAVASAFVSTRVVAQATFTVTKVADAASFVPGGPVGWTISVTNNGPSNASLVDVADPLVAAVSGPVVTGGRGARP